jgi:phosphate uptake regulator
VAKHDDDVQSSIDHLDAAIDRMSDVAINLLHKAMHEADPKQSPSAKAEKLVTRARRSAEKARHLLATIDLGDDQ